jgi:leucyl aminopeptidase
MKFEAYAGEAIRQRSDCLVLGLHEERELPGETARADKALGGRIAALQRSGDFTGRAGESLLLTGLPGGRARVLLVGLGPKGNYQRRGWKRAHSTAVAALGRTRVASATLALPVPQSKDQSKGFDASLQARAAVEAVGGALYKVNDQKSGKRPPRPALARLRIGPFAATELAAARRGLAEGESIIESSRLLRDLGNLPANICTPRYLASRATELGRLHKSLTVRAFDEARIRRLKMGCLLAVTRGSAEPPRFIVIEHKGGRRNAAPIVLVGKGVTFDTGGISLKDQAAMDEMKYDMCGAATVIATLDLVARLKLRLNVVGLVPACENMPGSRAIKPGDIVTSAAGQTVEILNTDAEGRLILCDALDYARRYQPAAVIDVATLTGACVVALGAHHTGVMGNDDALAQELVAAGLRAEDRAWQLPLTEEYGEQLKSNFADVANVAGRDGGAITAAAFLGRFTKGLNWAHLDIAGSAWLSGAAKGATGRPLGLLAEFLLRRAGA